MRKSKDKEENAMVCQTEEACGFINSASKTGMASCD